MCDHPSFRLTGVRLCFVACDDCVGYHTVSKILSISTLGRRCVRARLDFTGDFGHETGWLDISIDKGGLIEAIDADLD